MPKPSSLTLAKREILAHFANAGPTVYAKAKLEMLLVSQAGEWQLAKSTNVNDFIAFLQKSGGLRAYEFRADAYHKTIVRYAWGKSLVGRPRALSNHRAISRMPRR